MARTTESTAAGDIAQRVLTSAKYRNLDPQLVARVSSDAAQRFKDRNEAVKYVKRKLHQAFGAFLQGSPAQAVAGVVAAVSSGQAELRPAALSAMRAHASSAERLPWLEPFYGQIADWCGAPASVADLACGLNPLAIPWMQLAPGATYWACEIDTELVAALDGLGDLLGPQVSAQRRDLVAAPEVPQVELVLLLKTVTTLEQQSAGAAGRLLSTLECAHVVLSLPRRSLSAGRGYANDADAIVAAVAAGTRYRIVAQADFGDESLWHLTAAG